MRSYKLKTAAQKTLIMLALAGLSAGAEASLIQYSDRTTFEAQGTIVENYGFEDWGSSGGYVYPADPYTAHGVTYTSTQNVIMKPNFGYGNSSNIILNNYWSPLSGAIAGTYDMLGFDLGVLGGTSPLDFTITTNVGTYAFNNISVPNVRDGMTFFGFVADPGENITSMIFSSQFGGGYAPSLDNVTLGTAGISPNAVPEPATVALLGMGLAGLGFARRRKA